MATWRRSRTPPPPAYTYTIVYTHSQSAFNIIAVIMLHYYIPNELCVCTTVCTNINIMMFTISDFGANHCRLLRRPILHQHGNGDEADDHNCAQRVHTQSTLSNFRLARCPSSAPEQRRRRCRTPPRVHTTHTTQHYTSNAQLTVTRKPFECGFGVGAKHQVSVGVPPQLCTPARRRRPSRTPPPPRIHRHK